MAERRDSHSSQSDPYEHGRVRRRELRAHHVPDEIEPATSQAPSLQQMLEF